MVAWMKIVAVAMLIMFLDAIIQHWTGGGILLQGDRYTFVELLFFFFELIVTFIGIIIHALTHPNEIPADLGLLVSGLLSLVFFFVESIISLLLHFIRLPFELIGSALASQGIPFGVKVDLWVFGNFFIDLRSLTIGITVPNVHIELVGVYADFENSVIISILGTRQSSFFLYSFSIDNALAGGALAGTTRLGVPSNFNNFLAISIFMEDLLWTHPLTGYLSLPPSQLIKFPLEATGNMGSLLEDIIAQLNIPTLRNWVVSTWRDLGLGVASAIQSIPSYIELNLQKVNVVWQKKIHLVYR